MKTIYLSLGSNLADRLRNIGEMRRLVSKFLCKPVKVSRLMETEPVGVAGKQRWYLNCILSGRFSGSAEELLGKCRRVEKDLGRTRSKRYAPRTADIDVLMYNGELYRSSKLTIPHPRMLVRRFCLEGLKEIAPRTRVPGTGLTCGQLHGAMTKDVLSQKINFLAWRHTRAKKG